MAGLQVLHVDDEPDMRLLVKLSLDLDAGISTRSAATGEEALEVTTQWRPDVILLDAAMPGMDGLATLRALQANPKTAGIPVVFLTARCDAADLDRFATSGSAGVIAKPFDIRGLGSAIRAHARSGPTDAAVGPTTLPDFSGRVTTRPDGTASAGTAATATRALLLDGSGGGFALTIVEDGVAGSPGRATGQPTLHNVAAPSSTLDVLPLDRPTLSNLLGMDAGALVQGDTPPAGVPETAAAWSAGHALGCDPIATTRAAHWTGGSAAPLHVASASPAAPPDWLAALMHRGALH